MAKLKLAQEIFDIIYPVGTIYMCDNETNPSSRFGGTWVILPSGHIYSQGSGQPLITTGGSTNTGSTATTIAQEASHRHSIGHYNSNGNYVPNGASVQSFRRSSDVYSPYINGGPTDMAPSTYNDTSLLQHTGSGQGHTHTIQPTFVTVRCWRRTT